MQKSVKEMKAVNRPTLSGRSSGCATNVDQRVLSLSTAVQSVQPCNEFVKVANSEYL